MLLRSRWRLFAYLLGCAFLVSTLAFINCYPLVYSDSGTYIRSAFTLLPPNDRPIGYGLIIRAVTWQSTLWTVVLFQGAMVSWLLYEVLKQLLPATISIWRVHLCLVAVLMLCTSMPWYAAEIMPDALTPMIALMLFLLFVGQGLAVLKRIFLWICLFFFLIAHNSHVATSLLFLSLAAVFVILGRRSSKRFWLIWSGVLTTTLAGIFFVAGFNGAHGLRSEFSPSAHVFFAGRLCEGEILGDFLDERCGEENYALCPFKDELPTYPSGFIWGGSSMVDRLGGNMLLADSLLKPMIHDLMSDPEYLGRYVRLAMVASVTQFFQTGTNTGLHSFPEDSAPFSAIKQHLPWEASMYLHSSQIHNAWADISNCDRRVRLVLFLSVLLVLWCWRSINHAVPLRSLVLILGSWVILNAIVTGSLANVDSRLQSRVTWLIVLTACATLMHTPWGARHLNKYARIQ